MRGGPPTGRFEAPITSASDPGEGAAVLPPQVDPQRLISAPVAGMAGFVVHPVLRELAALLLLTFLAVYSFREAITQGLVAVQKDTQVFYYPLQFWFAEEFKAGRFPLWNPYIFAGYPIFGDGEIGLAYPPHLLLLKLLSFEQVFIWLRISSVAIAALAMYALCRALGLGRLPSVLGGMTFSLGSFFLSQQHHENVTRTAAWLPLVLACVEWSLHRAGWRRHMFLTLAAVALAMSAVGLHPQILFMSLVGFSTFVVFRVLAGPIGPRQTTNRMPFTATTDLPWRRRPQAPSAVRAVINRIALVVWVGGYVGGLGLGLASIQLLPLMEVGANTFRGTRPDYTFASSYALPVHNLVDLVFPYFFRSAGSDYWSLWAKWETTLYVGIVPLVLGLVALLIGRRRELWYFAGLAGVSLWLAFATYAPFDLYRLLWNLPGFSSFRVPGRYTYLFVLAWAVLAAFGLHALRTASEETRARWRRRLGLLLLCGLAVGVVAMLLLMTQMRDGLQVDEQGALELIDAAYLSLPHHPEGLNASDVYQGLVFSLDPANSRTRLAVVLLGLGLVLAGGTLIAHRSVYRWQLMLLGVAAFDLIGFGMNFHQKLPVSQIIQATPATEALTSRLPGNVPGGQGALHDYWRVYTPGTIYSVEFDRLVPFRIEEIGGYSSAESRQNYTYWTTIHNSQNQLLDLGNVRYLVYGAQAANYPSYRLVPFDPDRPLIIGGKDSIGSADTYRLEAIPAHRLQIISGLTRAVDIPQGTTVAEVVVYPRAGEPVVLPLRAGVHSAEWAYDRPDLQGKVQHEQPPEVAFRRPDVFPLDGSRYQLNLYYTEQDLPRRLEIDRVEVRYVHERGGIEVYGLGFYNFDTHETAGITPLMRDKLRLVHQDHEVRVYENLDAFPRVYVVPSARVAPEDSNALSAMQDAPFDPTREVMLDHADRKQALVSAGPDRGASGEQTTQGEPSRPAGPRVIPGGAEVVDYGTERVLVRASAPQGGYLVQIANYFSGWRAFVDGQETPIHRANGLFRTVALPPGEHQVELRYEPLAIALGIQLTILAACIAAATLAGAALAHRWTRPRRRSPRRV